MSTEVALKILTKDKTAEKQDKFSRVRLLSFTWLTVKMKNGFFLCLNLHLKLSQSCHYIEKTPLNVSQNILYLNIYQMKNCTSDFTQFQRVCLCFIQKLELFCCMYRYNVGRTTGRSLHSPALHTHTPQAGSAVSCIKHWLSGCYCLAVISVRVCVMISLTHPGSVLIDLLNAEIDCREAEEPYWSAAFIIHCVQGREMRGEERPEQEEKLLAGWPNSLLTGWTFTRQGDS